MGHSSQEEVLVVKDNIINAILNGGFGFIKYDIDVLYSGIASDYEYRLRSIVEREYEYRQIIPYAIVKYKDKYLLLKRKSAQNEERLHDMYSVGVGGHINKIDGLIGIKNIIREGFRRELNEEVSIKCGYNVNYMGIIRDNSTDVAKLHLGIVYMLDLKEDNINIIEVDKMSGSMKDYNEIGQYYDNMESWSQLVYDNVIS